MYNVIKEIIILESKNIKISKIIPQQFEKSEIHKALKIKYSNIFPMAIHSSMILSIKVVFQVKLRKN